MHMLSFIVRLFKLKCMYGLSNSALEAIFHLFSLVLPEGHCIPNTLDKVQKVVRDLGHRLRFLLQNVSNETHHCVQKPYFLQPNKKMRLKVSTTRLFATTANDHHVVAI